MKYLVKPNFKNIYLFIWVLGMFITIIPGVLLLIISFGGFKYFDIAHDSYMYLENKYYK